MSTKKDDYQAAYIIAVDDSPDNLALLEIILDDPKYTLELLKSGKEALKKIQQKAPDLLLLDVMMPGMDGFEVTRQIRQNENLPYIPIILLTAHDQISSYEGMNVGADDFIRKPFDIDELQERVEMLIHRSRQPHYLSG